MDTEMISPTLIQPPRDVAPSPKLGDLIESMVLNGWTGRPLLLVNGEAWTGSHRIAAAVAAGLEAVPCFAVEVPTEVFEEFGPVTDDDDRVALLKYALGSNAEAANLMRQEISDLKT